MVATLFLGVRLNLTLFHRVKMENVNLDTKVDLFKDEAAKQIQVDKQGIELVYCGNILEDDASLTSCGIKPGVMIHVLEKRVQEPPLPVRTMSEADIQQLVVAFRAFSSSLGYRAALHRLSRPDVLDNIIITTPGLVDDPIAIAMIQDPELIVHMSDPDTVRRIAELHPSLAEAANHIAAAVHEEAALANSSQAGPSSGYSYSLDALSDDDEMESSSSDGPREGQPLTRNASYSAITAAQLAAAIANATGSFVPPPPPPTTLATTTANGSTTGNNLITTEMFSNAMQQAFATSTSSPSTPLPAQSESIEAITSRLQPQLQQMHEIGLTNDSVNVRALQATLGDVQAAIELVFSGAM